MRLLSPWIIDTHSGQKSRDSHAISCGIKKLFSLSIFQSPFWVSTTFHGNLPGDCNRKCWTLEQRKRLRFTLQFIMDFQCYTLLKDTFSNRKEKVVMQLTRNSLRLYRKLFLETNTLTFTWWSCCSHKKFKRKVETSKNSILWLVLVCLRCLISLEPLQKHSNQLDFTKVGCLRCIQHKSDPPAVADYIY